MHAVAEVSTACIECAVASITVQHALEMSFTFRFCVQAIHDQGYNVDIHCGRSAKADAIEAAVIWSFQHCSYELLYTRIILPLLKYTRCVVRNRFKTSQAFTVGVDANKLANRINPREILVRKHSLH